MAKIIKNPKLILLAIVVVASFLRLWKLSVNPPSLFGDELDLGYQAYSILKTGRDYYGNFLPIHFHSLAEWRTPLYLYSAVPTVAVFGISPLGVRLPAAIFGILGVLVLYLLINQVTNNESLALTSAAVLALSPWHLQYSRAGFEVTLMLFLLILGLWLFFKALRKGEWLWLAAVCLALTPWVYSTAKLFTPALLLFLVWVWRKEIFSLPKKHLISGLVAAAVIGLPIAVSTLLGGGVQRFGYLSVFTDPTTEPEVGVAREVDARVRGETGAGLTPRLLDRVIHNKYTFWGKKILDNYFKAFSTDFLFVRGDLNLRHSIGTGEFYKVEAIVLLIGIVFFFSRYRVSNIQYLVLFWILAGVIPAAITRDGGGHATRLILILPPLIFLIASGAREILRFNKFVFLVLLGIWLLGIGDYLHDYYAHYPWQSERWWHSGWSEAIASVKEIEGNYNRVVISTTHEPPWIFFAGWYEYDPALWQKNFPIGNDVFLPGFGNVSHLDKFYFGSPERGGVYEFGKVLDSQTLYLADAKEVNVNLIKEPKRTPTDLSLIKAIAYPSGEPAFYLFSGKAK